MQAVILSIGSELVSGLRLDTHARDVARKLAEFGIEVHRHETLDDRTGLIASAFRRAAEEADVVIATGGLGPTPDDVTRDALAEAMAVGLVEHPEAARQLEQWAARRNRTLSHSNRRQAMLPDNAEPIANDEGSAPGIAATLNGAIVYCLPGVPGEMRAMLAGFVAPRLHARAGEGVRVVRTVRIFGMPESVLGERLADLMARGREPEVATAVHMGVIDVHIHQTGRREKVTPAVEADVRVVRERLGDAVFTTGRSSMQEVVAEQLREADATVALAESCTGGLVAAKLVDVPGMSRHLLEAVVAYSNEAKQRRLGVDADLIESHGAVSEPVARAMAEGIRREAESAWAVSITGIAGPTGGTAEKPVGLVWFGLGGPGETRAERHVFPGDRLQVRERAANYGLNMLRLALKAGRG